MATLFRPALCSSARAGLRPGVGGFARQAQRNYASEAKAGGAPSNTPLYLGLAGVGGLGLYYAMGGAGPPTLNETKGALDKESFKEFVLKEVRPYNHDSSTFVFELPDNAPAGMTVASAVLLKGAGEGVKDKDGKDVIRPYTPVSQPDTRGHIDFLIKRYENGNMTKHVHDMKVGDKIGIKGPIDKLKVKPNEYEEIGMIAGGSGITPMWQVMDAIASNPADKTKVTLIYTNKTDKDILLKEQFDKWAASDSRFKIVYGVDKMSDGLKGGHDKFEGYATPEILSKHLPAASLGEKAKILVCGPPPQVEAISGGKGPKGSQGELKGLLAQMGYQADQVYKF